MSIASRIPNYAPPGSLLKRPREAKKPRPIRPIREVDEPHLALIRKLPCLSCGQYPCGEAAHVRQASAAHYKRSSLGIRPDDKWAAPLCHAHHMEQHQEGELTFWYRLNLSPILICVALHQASPDLEKMREIVRDFREGRR